MSLLTALDIGAKDARERILDLLATVAGGYDDHVDSDLVGPISVAERVHVMSTRFHKLEMGLYETGYPSYVDILLMCAVHDENLRDAVSRAFRRALTLPSCAKIVGAIETALGELE